MASSFRPPSQTPPSDHPPEPHPSESTSGLHAAVNTPPADGSVDRRSWVGIGGVSPLIRRLLLPAYQDAGQLEEAQAQLQSQREAARSRSQSQQQQQQQHNNRPSQSVPGPDSVAGTPSSASRLLASSRAFLPWLQPLQEQLELQLFLQRQQQQQQQSEPPIPRLSAERAQTPVSESVRVLSRSPSIRTRPRGSTPPPPPLPIPITISVPTPSTRTAAPSSSFSSLASSNRSSTHRHRPHGSNNRPPRAHSSARNSERMAESSSSRQSNRTSTEGPGMFSTPPSGSRFSSPPSPPIPLPPLPLQISRASSREASHNSTLSSSSFPDAHPELAPLRAFRVYQGNDPYSPGPPNHPSTRRQPNNGTLTPTTDQESACSPTSTVPLKRQSRRSGHGPPRRLPIPVHVEGTRPRPSTTEDTSSGSGIGPKANPTRSIYLTAESIPALSFQAANTNNRSPVVPLTPNSKDASVFSIARPRPLFSTVPEEPKASTKPSEKRHRNRSATRIFHRLFPLAGSKSTRSLFPSGAGTSKAPDPGGQLKGSTRAVPHSGRNPIRRKKSASDLRVSFVTTPVSPTNTHLRPPAPARFPSRSAQGQSQAAPTHQSSQRSRTRNSQRSTLSAEGPYPKFYPSNPHNHNPGSATPSRLSPNPSINSEDISPRRKIKPPKKPPAARKTLTINPNTDISLNPPESAVETEPNPPLQVSPASSTLSQSLPAGLSARPKFRSIPPPAAYPVSSHDSQGISPPTGAGILPVLPTIAPSSPLTLPNASSLSSWPNAASPISSAEPVSMPEPAYVLVPNPLHQDPQLQPLAPPIAPFSVRPESDLTNIFEPRPANIPLDTSILTRPGFTFQIPGPRPAPPMTDTGQPGRPIPISPSLPYRGRLSRNNGPKRVPTLEPSPFSPGSPPGTHPPGRPNEHSPGIGPNNRVSPIFEWSRPRKASGQPSPLGPGRNPNNNNEHDSGPRHKGKEVANVRPPGQHSDPQTEPDHANLEVVELPGSGYNDRGNTPRSGTSSPSSSSASLSPPHSSHNSDQGSLPPPHFPSKIRPREIFFIILVAISHFMTQASLGQALAPLDIIGPTLGAYSIGQTSWFVAAYSLTVGTFILISGRLGDVFGHFNVYVAGWLWFGIWSAFTGFAAYATSQIFFDICRAMQGIGPALLMPNGLALLGRAYPPGIKKNIAFSAFGGLAPAGFVVGALTGSAWAMGVWWPWAFWTFGFGCFALAVACFLIIPRSLRGKQGHLHDRETETLSGPEDLEKNERRRKPAKVLRFPDTESDIMNPYTGEPARDHFRPKRQKSRRPSLFTRLDVMGSITGVLGLILVNIAWNNGPLFGWHTQHVIFTLVLGLVLLAWFGYIQRISPYPLLPSSALSSTTAFVIGCVAIGWGAFGIWVFYMFRFLQGVRGESALVSALHYVPAILCGLIAAGITGFLLTHTPVSFTMMCAMLAFFIGIVLSATMPAHQIYWANAFVSVVIMPFGMDMSFPAGSVILSNKMAAHQQGLAMSLVNTAVNYSISIALGIAGTVESEIVKSGMKSGMDPDALMVKGFKGAFWTAVILSGLGLLLCGVYFLRDVRKQGWVVAGH